MLKLERLIRKTYFNSFGRRRIPPLIRKEIKNDWTILDVGCGRSSALGENKKTAYRVGLDIYGSHIRESMKKSIHHAYVLGDVQRLPFESNSFDCVMATELLEHMEKDSGLQMITEMERVARKKIILTTPNGFLPTYAGPRDNPDECHLSGWAHDELKELGFRVYGLSGLKKFWTIRHGKAVIKLKVPILSDLLVDMSELFIYNCPSLAFQFFFVKDLDKDIDPTNAKLTS